jgi:hypothetical protein
MIAAPVVAPDEETDIRDEFYPDAAAEAYDAQPGQTTAADRRAAMQAIDGDPQLVEVADEYGEVHLMLPGEVAQFKRDHGLVEPSEDEPEPEPEPAKEPDQITVWLSPDDPQHVARDLTIAGRLIYTAVNRAENYGDLALLDVENAELISKLPEAAKTAIGELFGTKLAELQGPQGDEPEPSTEADPMADLEKFDGLPAEAAAKGKSGKQQERLV